MGYPAGIQEGPRGQDPPGSRRLSRVGPTWCPPGTRLGSVWVCWLGRADIWLVSLNCK